MAGHLESQNAPSKNEGLKYLRRLETQADCFSAAFLRSVSRSLGIQQADIDGILESYAAVGDDTLSHDPNVVGDHGLARSRRYWGNLGLGTVGRRHLQHVPRRRQAGAVNLSGPSRASYEIFAGKRPRTRWRGSYRCACDSAELGRTAA